eukprot:CAMPEP_0183743432 /NCGR_PEP_ID=MMETSP0737-20130205/65216_1 /TAXON_ID=385413 /ORGANISM="Thalassiosira miniscula, Strain CCMP1093" /LENGTH=131 /DNA_ID=CAMNT_0025979051 /DNA_START=128 /DNA_END=523 /DNA_ORIENTATION=+
MDQTFPPHWGPPPAAQTRDLVQLPGAYGRGSGTLRDWILEKIAEDDAKFSVKMAEDDANSAGAGKKWPDKDLVGLTGDEAKAAVLAGDSNLLAQNVQIVPHDAMVTMDFREDRVRIFVGDDGKVARQPIHG